MLTEAQIKAAKPGPKLTRLKDGGGLFLEVRPSGVKTFVRMYRFAGKPRTDTLGVWPRVKLSEARMRALEIGEAVKAKRDPRGEVTRTTRSARPRKPDRAGAALVPVERRFETLVEMFINKRTQEGIAEATANKLRWNLGYAKTHFGGRDIGGIEPPEVLRLVELIQSTGKLEKAKDIHRKLGQLFDYAVGLGLMDWNPAQMVKRAVVRTMGGRHPGLTNPQDVGGLMRAIRGYRGEPTTRAALLLSAYTVLRSGEIRPARWREIDTEASLWTIPKERMKGHYGDHLVPLSFQALKTLEFLHECLGRPGSDEFVFPDRTHRDRYMSNATMNSAIRRLGYDTRKWSCPRFSGHSGGCGLSCDELAW